MPSAQRGQIVKRGGRWSVRWYDHEGVRRRRGFGPGREGKAEAQAFLERTLRDVVALRRGDPIAVHRRDLPALGRLVDEYLAQHSGEENTKRALRERLRYATEGATLDGHGWRTTFASTGPTPARSPPGGPVCRPALRGRSRRPCGRF